MSDQLHDPGVQGLAQLGRNAIERVSQLEAELAGFREANKHMAGELEDALEDARKYAEAQREIARLREALALIAKTRIGLDPNDSDQEWRAYWSEVCGQYRQIARAALANGGG